ncbi:glycosyltransferase family 2 protein [Sphaerisporangium krabiense]|uniref:Hyaluronan synthase n=1 Tax=Sphaerisporangium krabiense TaxID=763782 RepID=A0A7W8Z1T0_9ACTN|nr:glycosyltransferase family 2 protein [Sphaerisporangium krabiense]MBB5625635.1 hyaluronan synthase [Sphaerisporangium krabiense]
MLAAAVVWILVFRAFIGNPGHWESMGVYLLTTGVLIAILGSTVYPRRFTHLPPAKGRVVAIVPAYNETTEALNSTIAALLNSTRPPDEIHVVDDGSKTPAVRFAHPFVHWHRRENGGKREAQAWVLRELRWARDHGRGRADFILTVDSDSVVDRRAIRHLLRAMSDERVQAATGLPMLRNRTKNLLTRLLDLEMVSACLTQRAARSRLGVVAPCSGALSLYRADLVLDNLDDYITSGTVGDDRRLTHYALQRGQTVAVDEAWVFTDMPETVRTTYRQRTRWYRSYWVYALWEVSHLRALPAAWRIYAMAMSALNPIALLWMCVGSPLMGKPFPLEGALYWLGLTYIIGSRYALRRPGVSAWSRTATWLLGTPFLLLLQYGVIRPAMWHAALTARRTGWVTRGPALDESALSMVA